MLEAWWHRDYLLLIAATTAGMWRRKFYWRCFLFCRKGIPCIKLSLNRLIRTPKSNTYKTALPSQTNPLITAIQPKWIDLIPKRCCYKCLHDQALRENERAILSTPVGCCLQKSWSQLTSKKTIPVCFLNSFHHIYLHIVMPLTAQTYSTAFMDHHGEWRF